MNTEIQKKLILYLHAYRDGIERILPFVEEGWDEIWVNAYMTGVDEIIDKVEGFLEPDEEETE